MPRERAEAVDGVDGCHPAGELKARRQAGIAHQGVQDGRGIGEPARLDDDALERRHPPLVPPPQDILERQHQIAAHRAAQAAGLQLDEALLAGHGRAREVGVPEQAPQQRSLAAAEEARQHGDGDHEGTSGSGAMRNRTGR
jgi:hypothetical protein